MIIGTVTAKVTETRSRFVQMYATYVRGMYYAWRKIGPLWYLWAELDEDLAEDACKMGLTECADAYETKEEIERYLAGKERTK